MAFRREQETRLDHLRERVLDGNFTAEEQWELDSLMRQAAHTSYEEEAPSLQEILRAIQMENEELAALLKRLTS